MKDLGSIDEHGQKSVGKVIKRTTKGFTIQADPGFLQQTFQRDRAGTGSLISDTWNGCDEAHC